MASQLKEILGLAEPATTDLAESHLGSDFKASVRQLLEDINEHIRVLRIHAAYDKYEVAESQRQRVYSAYQTVADRIKQPGEVDAEGDVDRTISALRKFHESVQSQAQRLQQACAAWEDRVERFELIADRAVALPESDRSAQATRKVVAAIRGLANERKYREANVAFDQLRAKFAADDADADPFVEAGDEEATYLERQDAIASELKRVLADNFALYDAPQIRTDLKAAKTEMKQAAFNDVYDLALLHLEQIQKLLDAYQALEKKLAEAKDFYEANYGGVKDELSAVLRDKPVDKAARAVQERIVATHSLMNSAMQNGDYISAKRLLDEILGDLEAYKKAQEALSKVGDQTNAERIYRRQLARSVSRLEGIVLEITPIPAAQKIQQLLSKAKDEMEHAASIGDYEAATKHLKGVEVLIAKYELALTDPIYWQGQYEKVVKGLEAQEREAARETPLGLKEAAAAKAMNEALWEMVGAAEREDFETAHRLAISYAETIAVFLKIQGETKEKMAKERDDAIKAANTPPPPAEEVLNGPDGDSLGSRKIPDYGIYIYWNKFGRQVAPKLDQVIAAYGKVKQSSTKLDDLTAKLDQVSKQLTGTSGRIEDVLREINKRATQRAIALAETAENGKNSLVLVVNILKDIRGRLSLAQRHLRASRKGLASVTKKQEAAKLRAAGEQQEKLISDAITILGAALQFAAAIVSPTPKRSSGKPIIDAISTVINLFRDNDLIKKAEQLQKEALALDMDVAVENLAHAVESLRHVGDRLIEAQAQSKDVEEDFIRQRARAEAEYDRTSGGKFKFRLLARGVELARDSYEIAVKLMETTSEWRLAVDDLQQVQIVSLSGQFRDQARPNGKWISRQMRKDAERLRKDAYKDHDEIKPKWEQYHALRARAGEALVNAKQPK